MGLLRVHLLGLDILPTPSHRPHPTLPQPPDHPLPVQQIGVCKDVTPPLPTLTLSVSPSCVQQHRLNPRLQAMLVLDFLTTVSPWLWLPPLLRRLLRNKNSDFKQKTPSSHLENSKKNKESSSSTFYSSWSSPTLTFRLE